LRTPQNWGEVWSIKTHGMANAAVAQRGGEIWQANLGNFLRVRRLSANAFFRSPAAFRDAPSARSARLVHRGLRHARFKGGEGAARRVGLTNWHSCRMSLHGPLRPILYYHLMSAFGAKRKWPRQGQLPRSKMTRRVVDPVGTYHSEIVPRGGNGIADEKRALGGVDTYRSHRMMAARVTTAR
jgi:hypothetical protein